MDRDSAAVHRRLFGIGLGSRARLAEHFVGGPSDAHASHHSDSVSVRSDRAVLSHDVCDAAAGSRMVRVPASHQSV